jgi:hypothetical protein
MKNPENVPLSKLPDDSSLADVIVAINKIIVAINSMWDTENNI